MASATKIIEFDPSYGVRTRSGSFTAVETGQRRPAETSTASSSIDDAGGEIFAADSKDLQRLRMSQAELYPVRKAFSREHITALRLLKLAIGRSKRALDAIAANDILDADTEVQKLQVLLPELFCCRSLGDGFGTIINSLMSAFEALEGNTPNANQIRTVNSVLRLLKEKPFLSADEADEQVEVLESAGLSPYPAELIEFLSSD